MRRTEEAVIVKVLDMYHSVQKSWPYRELRARSNWSPMITERAGKVCFENWQDRGILSDHWSFDICWKMTYSKKWWLFRSSRQQRTRRSASCPPFRKHRSWHLEWCRQLTIAPNCSGQQHTPKSSGRLWWKLARHLGRCTPQQCHRLRQMLWKIIHK